MCACVHVYNTCVCACACMRTEAHQQPSRAFCSLCRKRRVERFLAPHSVLAIHNRANSSQATPPDITSGHVRSHTLGPLTSCSGRLASPAPQQARSALPRAYGRADTQRLCKEILSAITSLSVGGGERVRGPLFPPSLPPLLPPNPRVAHLWGLKLVRVPLTRATHPHARWVGTADDCVTQAATVAAQGRRDRRLSLVSEIR